MSRVELLRRAREDLRLRETLFVMMTTKEHAHAFTAVRKAGVNACLTKPFMCFRTRDKTAVSGLGRHGRSRTRRPVGGDRAASAV